MSKSFLAMRLRAAYYALLVAPYVAVTVAVLIGGAGAILRPPLHGGDRFAAVVDDHDDVSVFFQQRHGQLLVHRAIFRQQDLQTA